MNFMILLLSFIPWRPCYLTANSANFWYLFHNDFDIKLRMLLQFKTSHQRLYCLWWCWCDDIAATVRKYCLKLLQYHTSNTPGICVNDVILGSKLHRLVPFKTSHQRLYFVDGVDVMIYQQQSVNIF